MNLPRAVSPARTLYSALIIVKDKLGQKSPFVMKFKPLGYRFCPRDASGDGQSYFGSQEAALYLAAAPRQAGQSGRARPKAAE